MPKKKPPSGPRSVFLQPHANVFERILIREAELLLRNGISYASVSRLELRWIKALSCPTEFAAANVKDVRAVMEAAVKLVPEEWQEATFVLFGLDRRARTLTQRRDAAAKLLGVASGDSFRKGREQELLGEIATALTSLVMARRRNIAHSVPFYVVPQEDYLYRMARMYAVRDEIRNTWDAIIRYVPDYIEEVKIRESQEGG